MTSENESRTKKSRKSSFQKSPKVKPSAVKEKQAPAPPILPATKYFQDLSDDNGVETSGFKEAIVGAVIGLCVGSFLCWLGVEFSWRMGEHATGPHYFSGEIVIFGAIAAVIIGYLSSRRPRDFRDSFGWWW